MADMVFVVTADAPLHITQRGREQVLDAGDAIFLRGSERSVIESGGRTTFTNISVPIDELTPMLASGEDLSMATVSRSEEHTSELQSLMRISYAVFCLKKKNHK